MVFLVLIPLTTIVLSTAVFAEEGITQANNYRKNCQIQFQLAMEALNAFDIEQTDKVLDVGCGDGQITAIISSKVAQGTVIGLDVSKQMIEGASSLFNKNNLLFFQCRAEAIPFREQFQKIVSFNSLHWIADQKEALLSMKNSLKPDGKMLLVVRIQSANHNNIGEIGKTVASFQKWSSHFPSFAFERSYRTPEDYINLFNEIGLKIEMFKIIRGYAIYPNKAALIEWIRPLANFIGHLSQDQQEEFIEDMADLIISKDPPYSDGTISKSFDVLQIIVEKPV